MKPHQPFEPPKTAQEVIDGIVEAKRSAAAPITQGELWDLQESLKMACEERDMFKSQLGEMNVVYQETAERLAAAEHERNRLSALINNPHIDHFFDAVRYESAHQAERWGQDDQEKTDVQWFWTLGWLAGKAVHHPEKRLHHIITSAAILYSWFKHCTGTKT